jgi:hypothetical protein
MEPKDRKKPESVVKKGGIARDDAEAEDVTRDTYGYDQPEEPGPERTHDERIAEANRTAAALGAPNLAVPDSGEVEE